MKEPSDCDTAAHLHQSVQMHIDTQACVVCEHARERERERERYP